MKDRYGLLQRGLFPETLPPCFTSVDSKRAFVGLVRSLNGKAFHNRATDFVPYSGTKHDGSRRYFGSPNPISYFYVASFIAEQWPIFEARFSSSPFSVSQPKLAPDSADRPIVIPSLSELTTVASAKLRYASHILKADIAQFFPSIYTHAIAWSAHGLEEAKRDQNPKSKALAFNRLDFFVRNCQRGETRGVLVGPDAFRLIAEFIAAGIDDELNSKISAHTVGAARHVDDYFVGLSGEPAALLALSALRDTLMQYNLNINDTKTKIIPGVEPLNELWAQDLRSDARKLQRRYLPAESDEVVLFLTKALTLARQINSDSPVKIALRAMDQIGSYRQSQWEQIEPYLQRIISHHPHCIDYVALLVVKRSAINRSIDADGWKAVAYGLIDRHLALNHHHEVVWLIWLLLSLKIELTDQLTAALANNENDHIRALLVAGYLDRRISRKPPIRLGSKLATTDCHWLLNLVARAGGYTGASFSGQMAAEFEHLAKKKIKLIDFRSHLKAASKSSAHAISRTRYGYDSDDEDEDEDHDDLDAEFFDRLRRDDT